MDKLDNNEISNSELSKVVGGVGNGGLNESKFNPNNDEYSKKREEWKNDSNKKREIKDIVERFDSSMIRNMAIGECPGCGCLVNSIGNVCAECRKQCES